MSDTRGPTDPFKKRLQYVLSIFDKRNLEIGGVRVDASADSFTIFTPAGAAVHEMDEFTKWEQEQAK